MDVQEPTLLTSSEVNVSNVSCFGGNDGSAEVVGINGTPGYTYSWSNGQTNALATGLALAHTYVQLLISMDVLLISQWMFINLHYLLPMKLVCLMLFVLDNPRNC